MLRRADGPILILLTFAVLAVGGECGCRGIFGLDPLPAAATTDSGTETNDASVDRDASVSSGAARGSDGGGDSAADNHAVDGSFNDSGADATPPQRDVDRAWAAWPLPPDSPSAVNYSVTSETTTDETTHLVWQKSAVSPRRTWQQAHDYCDTLTLANQTDWRLPKRIELWSIVDFGRSNPSINSVAFPQTPPALFWTDSLDAANGSTYPTYRAWAVSFDEGDAQSFTSSDHTFMARCVRGG